jgi:hypothetical protein
LEDKKYIEGVELIAGFIATEVIPNIRGGVSEKTVRRE